MTEPEDESPAAPLTDESPDSSVAAAADQIDRILFGRTGSPPVAAAQELESPRPETPPTDSRALALKEFADVLGGAELSHADLLGRLATLAHHEPGRFDRLRALAASIGAAAPTAAGHEPEAASTRQLAELIPEWADPAQAARGLSEVRQFLTGHGVPDSYTRTMSDPREIAIARKAMLFDRAVADRGRLGAKRVPLASRSMAPGAMPEGDRVDPSLDGLRARLRQSGRLEDAAALIERMLFRQ